MWQRSICGSLSEGAGPAAGFPGVSEAFVVLIGPQKSVVGVWAGATQQLTEGQTHMAVYLDRSLTHGCEPLATTIRRAHQEWNL